DSAGTVFPPLAARLAYPSVPGRSGGRGRAITRQGGKRACRAPWWAWGRLGCLSFACFPVPFSCAQGARPQVPLLLGEPEQGGAGQRASILGRWARALSGRFGGRRARAGEAAPNETQKPPAARCRSPGAARGLSAPLRLSCRRR